MPSFISFISDHFSNLSMKIHYNVLLGANTQLQTRLLLIEFSLALTCNRLDVLNSEAKAFITGCFISSYLCITLSPNSTTPRENKGETRIGSQAHPQGSKNGLFTVLFYIKIQSQKFLIHRFYLCYVPTTVSLPPLLPFPPPTSLLPTPIHSSSISIQMG